MEKDSAYQSWLRELKEHVRSSPLMQANQFDDGDFIDEFSHNFLCKEKLIWFLLELNMGFSFAGKQISIVQDGQECMIDLLFYHYKLRCFVVVDLKAGEFLPGFISTMNSNLKLVDEKFKCQTDNNTIGLLICKNNGDIVTEYSIPGNHLSALAPNNLETCLPTKEQIENCLRLDD